MLPEFNASQLSKVFTDFINNIDYETNAIDPRVKSQVDRHLSKNKQDEDTGFERMNLSPKEKQLQINQLIVSSKVNVENLLEELNNLNLISEPDLKEERFKEILGAFFKFINVSGDGNCGLRSVVRSLNPSFEENVTKETKELEKNLVDILRHEMVDTMIADYDNFMPYCVRHPKKPTEDVDPFTYLEVMLKSGTYIGNPEMGALAKYLKTPIFVYTQGSVEIEEGKLIPNPEFRLGQEFIGQQPIIHLYYCPEHYQKLLLKTPIVETINDFATAKILAEV